MRGSPEERKAVRQSFRKMNTSEKIKYIFTYYKLPVFTVCCVIALIISTAVRELTKKDPVLYVAYANISVSEETDLALTESYLEDRQHEPKKKEVRVYRDLYLAQDPAAQDHQYAYASKMKILGAINARQLDVVLMNKEAYDQMSLSGFLMNLEDIRQTDSALYETLKPYLTQNTVILEDNSIEYSLGEADEYEAVTEEVFNAIEVSSCSLFKKAGIDGNVYAAVIAEDPRQDESLAYLAYIIR